MAYVVHQMCLTIYSIYALFGVRRSTREKGNESMYPQIPTTSVCAEEMIVAIVFIQRPRVCANSDHDHFCFTFANVM